MHEFQEQELPPELPKKSLGTANFVLVDSASYASVNAILSTLTDKLAKQLSKLD
jgi:hypothetical protein